MKEYAVISGSSIICIVKARDFKSAAKKALVRLAQEYQRKYSVKIVRYAGRTTGASCKTAL